MKNYKDVNRQKLLDKPTVPADIVCGENNLSSLLYSLKEGGPMKNGLESNVGKKELLKKYRKAFRIPENLNYYSAEDFKIAERSFIKHAILNGIETQRKALIKPHPVLTQKIPLQPVAK